MRVIDSHTGGEPTRLVIEGGPDLGDGSLAMRRALLAERHDHLRGFCLSEPRGFDAIVGAFLTPPVDPVATAGLIFFNNAGYLGMCGHGTIGAVVTLAHLGRIGPGTHLIETPVGPVTARLDGRNRVTIDNVPSYLLHADIELDVDGIGKVRGDVAWGGNWFFLTEDSPVAIEPANIPQLTAAGLAVKAALARRGIVGDDGGEVDHIEFFGPGGSGADSRNFVLCPGAAYDRSPCGTGTSAKLACLAAHGALAPGAVWVQESVIGSRFEASYRLGPAGEILPTITGEAHVTADATLILDPSDPFPNGIF